MEKKLKLIYYFKRYKVTVFCVKVATDFHFCIAYHQEDISLITLSCSFQKMSCRCYVTGKPDSHILTRENESDS